MFDLVNGGFELLGGLAVAQSCLRLARDKQVRGVSVLHMGFFTAWGFWNLAYYPSLGQWLSFAGGVGVVATNSLYVAMLVYYRKA
jgi:hypothetical protein